MFPIILFYQLQSMIKRFIITPILMASNDVLRFTAFFLDVPYRLFPFFYMSIRQVSQVCGLCAFYKAAAIKNFLFGKLDYDIVRCMPLARVKRFKSMLAYSKHRILAD